MLETGGYQPGDLAGATHRSPGTAGDDNDDDNDDDGDDAVVADNSGGGDGDDDDKDSSEHEVHHVPTRRQLAKQRSRRKLFRRPRRRFETAGQHAQVRPMARLVVAGRCRVGGQRWSDDTESVLNDCDRQ